MQTDFSQQIIEELDSIDSIEDFCRNWGDKWRPYAVAAQSALKLLFPAGAKVIGYLIVFADSFCKQD